MKKILIILLLLIAVGVGGYFAKDTLLPRLNGDTLEIVMNTEATDISPYGLNLNNITRVANMYEGLVAFDRYLKIVPRLALSWGNLNDTTWEFKLRQGVTFHDDSPFTAQDVIDSFKAAKASGNAQISPLISTIKEMRSSGNDKIEIVTFAPDPLLLSKLTKLFIHKDSKVGTGPYLLKDWTPGSHFKLEAYPNYWGKQPVFKYVTYTVETSRVQREQDFNSKTIDILVGISEDQALELPKNKVKSSYGLEINFLMFKLDDPLFSQRQYREAILSMIDPATIEEIGNHFVRASNQFIAPGVFGYNQAIPSYEYTPEKEAKDLFGNRLERVDFDFLASYQTLSEYLIRQLRKAGFSVKANPLDPETLLTKIRANESQLYLIGWQASDGDAGGFFDAFIHSDGTFNQGRFKNEEIDRLIEESRTEMNPQKRLALLQDLNAKVSAELIGIPLFETSRLYGVQEYVSWEPRLDGMVLASEVSR